MRIRYTTSMAGPGTVICAGHVGDETDEQAARLIAAGFAEPVSSGGDRPAGAKPRTQKVSKATAKPPQKTVARE